MNDVNIMGAIGAIIVLIVYFLNYLGHLCALGTRWILRKLRIIEEDPIHKRVKFGLEVEALKLYFLKEQQKINASLSQSSAPQEIRVECDILALLCARTISDGGRNFDPEELEAARRFTIASVVLMKEKVKPYCSEATNTSAV